MVIDDCILVEQQLVEFAIDSIVACIQLLSFAPVLCGKTMLKI